MSDSAEERALSLVGTTLADAYRLDALIGQGAMGAVYRATSAAGAEVAVKTLSPNMMGDQIAQRFLRESELVRRLDHPHVVRTLDSGQDKATGLMFLVMPLLNGKDLDRVLEELGALEPRTAVRIALQAARGLSAAHRIGIIHRDVKPGNLILDEEGGKIIVRVCDFGIAKQMGGESSLTKTGSQLGTPDYVSPEQLKSSKHVDERTDVWSLGATLYQMLCGAAPFAHIDSVFDVITAIVSEDVPHLRGRAPWLDPSLSRIVHQALQRDPNQRWRTLEDLADALRPFSGGSDRIATSQLVALTDAQRAEPTLHVRPDSAAQRTPNVGEHLAITEAAAASSKGGAVRSQRPARAPGASKATMVAVGLLSAAIAGASAFYLVRATRPALAPPPAGIGRVTARLEVVPPDATVVLRGAEVPVVNGQAQVQGQPGETLRVTVQRGAESKTFAVSLGSDGIATPGRLVLGP